MSATTDIKESRLNLIKEINNIAWEIFWDYQAGPPAHPSTTAEERRQDLALHKREEEAEYRTLQRVLDALDPSEEEVLEALDYPAQPWQGHGELKWP